MPDDNDKEQPSLAEEGYVNAAIRLSQEQQLGVVDSTFLSRSVSVLEPRRPFCVSQDDTLAEALGHLQRLKVGCVLVVDTPGRLVGLLSERDFILKIFKLRVDLEQARVREYMTSNPVAEPPDTSIAYALNLMSQGGFRHLPLIDSERVPVGVISVKDVVDYIVESYTQALLDFEIPYAED